MALITALTVTKRGAFVDPWKRDKRERRNSLYVRMGNFRVLFQAKMLLGG